MTKGRIVLFTAVVFLMFLLSCMSINSYSTTRQRPVKMWEDIEGVSILVSPAHIGSNSYCGFRIALRGQEAHDIQFSWAECRYLRDGVDLGGFCVFKDDGRQQGENNFSLEPPVPLSTTQPISHSNAFFPSVGIEEVKYDDGRVVHVARPLKESKHGAILVVLIDGQRHELQFEYDVYTKRQMYCWCEVFGINK
ncbi:hypothetical protein ACFL4W_03160 [Planctomycetota bacterium]